VQEREGNQNSNYDSWTVKEREENTERTFALFRNNNPTKQEREGTSLGKEKKKKNEKGGGLRACYIRRPETDNFAKLGRTKPGGRFTFSARGRLTNSQGLGHTAKEAPKKEKGRL